ncbi:MAG: hypothetical protein ACF8K1_05365 [Phycisphaerales bacterium JB047]
MRVIGIDPGLNGAVALIDNGVLEVESIPVLEVNGKKRLDLQGLASLLRTIVNKATTVVVERQQAMTKQGVSSTFRTGFGYGAILGILAALGAEVQEVRAQDWKTDYPTLKGMERRDAKNEARRLASDYFKDNADSFSRVKDDGRAEAALIALAVFKKLVEEKKESSSVA